MEDSQTALTAENYSSKYLAEYWPPDPSAAALWIDNAVLMLAYQEVGLVLLKHRGAPGKMLDIASGPALTPLMAMLPTVSEVQLSDYESVNRKFLQEHDIEYWENYVPMLSKLFPDPVGKRDYVLGRLDALRRQHTPLEVDLMQPAPFGKGFDSSSFDIVSMNFVADSITSTKEDYLACLGKATDLVRSGGYFAMSAIIDSSGWSMGEEELPSPEVDERTVLDFLSSQGLDTLHIARSMGVSGLPYSGRWIALAAYKE